MVGPNGEILPLSVSALRRSPFANYFVPGAILFAILGVGPLVAAALARRRHPVAPLLAVATGGALLIWLFVEITILRYRRSISRWASSWRRSASPGGARRADAALPTQRTEPSPQQQLER